MVKKLLLAILIVVLVLPVALAQVSNLRPEAKTAGYHNVMYTNYIQNVNTTDVLYIYPQVVTIGWIISGGSLNIVGDGAGNYAIGPAVPATHSMTLTSAVTVSGNLNANGDIRLASGKVITSTGNFVVRLS